MLLNQMLLKLYHFAEQVLNEREVHRVKSGELHLVARFGEDKFITRRKAS